MYLPTKRTALQEHLTDILEAFNRRLLRYALKLLASESKVVTDVAACGVSVMLRHVEAGWHARKLLCVRF